MNTHLYEQLINSISKKVKRIINEEYITDKSKLKLPYTFDIYNCGQNNKNFRITKMQIPNICFALQNGENEDFAQMLLVEKPGKYICYKETPTRETMNSITIEDIEQYYEIGFWHTKKSEHYPWANMEYDWMEWLKKLMPYIHGRISATFIKSNDKDYFGKYHLILKINDAKFQEEREKRINELLDPIHIEDLVNRIEEEQRKREERKLKEIEDQKIRTEQQKKDQEEFEIWYNSLSDDEKYAYDAGYTVDGRRKYNTNWTGD